MRKVGWTLAVAAVVLAGCAARNRGSSDTLSAGEDSAATEANIESLASSFVSGTGTGAGLLTSPGQLNGSNLTVDSFGDGAKAFYQPTGCLTVTNDTVAQQATYVFNGCTGPYGLVKVTGTVTLGYSSSGPDQLTLDYSATGLQVNGSVVDWSATAGITASGNDRDMIWDGQFSGTTAHARAIHRTNHKEFKWTVGQLCLSVAGSSDGTVTGRELKTDVVAYSQCAGSCPQSGSEIKVTDVVAKQIYDLTYGTDTATYTAPDGKSYTYTPLCAY